VKFKHQIERGDEASLNFSLILLSTCCLRDVVLLFQLPLLARLRLRHRTVVHQRSLLISQNWGRTYEATFSPLSNFLGRSRVAGRVGECADGTE